MNYEVGRKVLHRSLMNFVESYGVGNIINIDKDFIEVDFENIGVRKFDIRNCDKYLFEVE